VGCLAGFYHLPDDQFSDMRKWLLLFLIVAFATSIGWMAYSSIQTLKKNEQRLERVSVLPQLIFESIDSHENRLDLIGDGRPTILVLFNSQCEHCQYETKSILSNIGAFEGVQLVFVSEESMDQVENFGKAYGLIGLPKITLGRADITHLIDLFKTISYPNIFIYGSDGKLIKEFKGETRIDLILELLENINA